MRNLFARETLDLDPEPPAHARRARSLARALFAIEELPPEPPASPPAPGRPGLLHALLVPERLGEEPVEAPRPSRYRWLAWLFRPESLDPP